MAREFTTVGVIGLGTMGAGIVEVFARSGMDVVAVEVDEPGVEHGKAVLAGSTGRALSRGKLTQEDHDALHGRVTYTTDLADLAPRAAADRPGPSRPAGQAGVDGQQVLDLAIRMIVDPGWRTGRERRVER